MNNFMKMVVLGATFIIALIFASDIDRPKEKGLVLPANFEELTDAEMRQPVC